MLMEYFVIDRLVNDYVARSSTDLSQPSSQTCLIYYLIAKQTFRIFLSGYFYGYNTRLLVVIILWYNNTLEFIPFKLFHCATHKSTYLYSSHFSSLWLAPAWFYFNKSTILTGLTKLKIFWHLSLSISY